MENVSKKKIVPIKDIDVRRIVSGQAITDLASAVKELIDNSLDAGGRSITVRLVNNGIDKIEVDDDGTGVALKSRQYIATKHATSKIASFEDLYSDENLEPPSLGFRGEALFCLCNISQNIVITTKTAEERVGQKLEFNRDGTLDESKVECIAKKVGTNVQIVKIFNNLPVRRMDFTKRIKSQRQRLLKLIQGYAVLCVGVKFSLIDVKKGKSDVILSTTATSRSVENTVSSVLGAKFLMGLIRINIDLQSILVNTKKEPHSESKKSNQIETSKQAKIEGLISTNPVDKDCARDLQFFSINDRPVDLPKMTRLLAEVWRSSESTTAASKRPACVLKLTLPRSQFDVNVDPSKREVILVEEQKINDLLREALIERWSTASSEATFVTNHVGTPKQKNVISPAISREKFDFRQFMNSNNSTSKQSRTIQSEMSRKMNSVKELNSTSANQHEQWRRAKRDFNTAVVSPQEEDNKLKRSKVQQCELYFSNSLISSESNDDTKESPKDQKDSISKNLIQQTPCSAAIISWKDRKRARKEDQTFSEEPIAKQSKQKQSVEREIEKACATISDVKENKLYSLANNQAMNEEPIEKQSKQNQSVLQDIQAEKVCKTRRDAKENNVHSENNTVNEVTWHSFQSTDDVIMKASLAKNSLNKMRKALLKSKGQRHRSFKIKTESQKEQDETDIPCTPPPVDDLIGEDESITPKLLNENEEDDKITLCKQDFLKMSVIGQFNLGFILARCPNNHLWILDQHGCDERYRLEHLAENTVIHQQSLLSPLPLELSPIEENCILDHLDLFQKNGFRFKCNPEHPIRHRLSLTALPHSGSGTDGRQAVQFGKDDISALCNILLCSDDDIIGGYGCGVNGSSSNGNNAVRRYVSATNKSAKTIRLPKAIAMFASRACRASVMIGTPLSRKEMINIVQQMHSVDSPWVCAHGRPTIRLVKNLNEYLVQDDLGDTKYIANPCLGVWTQIDDGSESSDNSNDLEVLEEV